MAPLVVRHSSRWFSVSGQVLASILLVKNSVALVILSRNSFTFCTLLRSAVPFTNPQTKRARGVKTGKRRGQGMCPTPWYYPWSGNSLSRKSQTRLEKWGGALSDWRIVSTEIWRKAVFSIIARKVSPLTTGSSKNKGPITSWATHWASVKHAHHENFHFISWTESKRDGPHPCAQMGLTKRKNKLKSYHTKQTSAQFNSSFRCGNVFCLLSRYIFCYSLSIYEISSLKERVTQLDLNHCCTERN